MSTIASPRDPSGPFPRRTNSSIITPTSSSRPSLDVPASASGSPNPNNTTTSTSTSTTSQSKRANRTALREYYNIRASSPSVPTTNTNANKPLPSPPTLDSADFDAPAYLAQLLSTASLADLLRTYAGLLGEMRALDAERKALVYDNYSKLIAATETIRRMRATRGDGELEGVVEGIYKMAVELREGLREVVKAPPPDGEVRGVSGDDAVSRRERTRELAREVVKVPGWVRRLMEEGREGEARREWEAPRRLLVRWKELGVGGREVGALIEEGDAALR
ncbi:hypothetical protein N658DRAFT_451197, partial [Parathielavia hyrcaniae]